MPTLPDSPLDHKGVQSIAHQAMEILRASLRPGQNLIEIRARGERTLLELGADSFWYWDIGAFVFAGEETVLSVSGRDHRTSDRVLGRDDIITIDLSPQVGSTWGDLARTVVIEDGLPLEDPRLSAHPEWREGVTSEHVLHARLVEVAHPGMTFDQLATTMNAHIAELGYENLDFLGNLGHSIVRDPAHRIYLEPGNGARLDSAELFTFEPHIRRPGGRFGYKHENIYRFVDGRLEAL